MLGLKHGTNRLVDHDLSWATEFGTERSRINAVLFGIIKGIEHYGSTSVPGIRAKPILDILIGVYPLDDWKLCLDPLIQLGYDYAEHAGVPGHYIFGKGRDKTERTHLVHIVEFNGESWRSNLAFRDELRSNSQLRKAYQIAKESAVSSAPLGRAEYNELKQKFINQAKAKLSW